ncbi:hypothetical protein CHS0354_005006 [Potamilus streckersoni]|uniref:Peroxisomal trans-2-enoyl-CoA reductase n=1 Tax=Potamilus streckersoni TaxID=2493646 RepID=A0AAE0SS51_9BIVA|nr:hypothetical protein CHS0354_005006 [Potamilus streckersoni]
MAASTAQRVSSIFRPGLFKNKVAVVTGGGTGIGKAISQELLHLGCKVMIASRNKEVLASTVQQLREQIQPGNTAEIAHIQCNIRKEDEVKNLISGTLAQFGSIDFLINNAGGQYQSPASQINTKGWNAVIETNLTGTFICCREAFNQWMKDHGGAIVNIILVTFRGIPTMSHSGAARAGVDNLTKSLAIEWAQNGVRVNSVAPGRSIYTESAAAIPGYDKVFAEAIPANPAKRLGTVEEISAATCFLLSPAASFISGVTLKVDAAGGLYSTSWDIPHHNKIPAYKWSEESDTENTKSKL